MRRLGERILAVLAIYAIVMQAFVAGLGPLQAAAAPAFDPYTITCLNGGHDASAADQGNTGSTHASQCCDHCVLCSANPAASAPDVSSLISFNIRPAGLPQSAAAAARKPDATHRPALPRGPPLTV